MARNPAPKPDNPEQYKRFLETAREVGAEQPGEGFDRVLRKVAGGVEAQSRIPNEGHPLERNVALVMCDYLANAPASVTIRGLQQTLLAAGYDHSECGAGLAYAQREGWIRAAPDESTLVLTGSGAVARQRQD